MAGGRSGGCYFQRDARPSSMKAPAKIILQDQPGPAEHSVNVIIVSDPDPSAERGAAPRAQEEKWNKITQAPSPTPPHPILYVRSCRSRQSAWENILVQSVVVTCDPWSHNQSLICSPHRCRVAAKAPITLTRNLFEKTALHLGLIRSTPRGPSWAACPHGWGAPAAPPRRCCRSCRSCSCPAGCGS